MTISFRPAKREAAPILFGLAGGTGSGKTMSALRVGTGLAGGQRFAVIDTENGRALHYADQYKFDHARLDPPFRPERYAEAIKKADADGYPVIVVDSASHEHAGEGGLLDWHDEILRDEFGGRQSSTFAAWVKPKTGHKGFVNALLQVKAHVILCFRAEDKIEIVKDGDKTKIIPKKTGAGFEGWIPIAEKNLPYELTISLLLTPDQPGYPKPIKVQEQHQLFVPLNSPLTEATGEALAAWANGASGQKETRASGPPNVPETPSSGDDGNADALVETLLSLADQLGAKALAEESVHAKRVAVTGDEFVAWLERQIATAEKNVAAKK